MIQTRSFSMPGQKLLVLISMAVSLSLTVYTTFHNAPSQSISGNIHSAYLELHSGHQNRSLQQNTTQNITNSTQTMVKHKGKSNKPFFFDGVYYESSEAFGATGKICGTKGLPAHLRAKIQKEVEKYMMQKFGPYDPTDPYGVYSPNNPNNTNVTTDQNGTNGTNSTDISQGANSTENTNGSNGTEAANITQGKNIQMTLKNIVQFVLIKMVQAFRLLVREAVFCRQIKKFS